MPTDKDAERFDALAADVEFRPPLEYELDALLSERAALREVERVARGPLGAGFVERITAALARLDEVRRAD